LPGQVVLGGFAGLTLFCALIGDGATARLGLCLTAIGAATVLPWQISWWPIPGVVGLCVYFAAHARARRLPSGPPAVLRCGRIGARQCLYVLGLVLTSAIALLVFEHFFPPQVGPEAGFLLALAPGPLVAVGLAFAMVNAFVEEALFRGVIMHHLQGTLGTWLAVGLQALLFGMLHLDGYPYGPLGVVMAGAYGVLLGLLRVHSGGLLACWLAHVCADVVIFAAIAGLVP
jgi:uncharacterized protein